MLLRVKGVLVALGPGERRVVGIVWPHPEGDGPPVYDLIGWALADAARALLPRWWRG